MSANNCFAVITGWGGNEKTAKHQAFFIKAFAIGFTILVGFFIAHIGYMSLADKKNTILSSKYHLARFSTTFETDLQ